MEYQLFAEGLQEFFMKAVDAQLAFDVDGSGTTTGLTLRYGDDWNPSQSGSSKYREYASDAGRGVWVKLAGNPPVRQAPLKPAFSVPAYRDRAHIAIPDDWPR